MFYISHRDICTILEILELKAKNPEYPIRGLKLGKYQYELEKDTVVGYSINCPSVHHVVAVRQAGGWKSIHGKRIYTDPIPVLQRLQNPNNNRIKEVLERMLKRNCTYWKTTYAVYRIRHNSMLTEQKRPVIKYREYTVAKKVSSNWYLTKAEPEYIETPTQTVRLDRNGVLFCPTDPNTVFTRIQKRLQERGIEEYTDVEPKDGRRT